MSRNEPRVVFGTVNKARFAATQEGKADHVKTGGIDDATVVTPDHELPPRPKPRNKRVRATLKGKDAAFKEVQREFEERDPEGKKERSVRTDGDDALQDRALQHLAGPNGNLTLILDIMHVLDYVWDAAYAFHAAGSADASRWVMNMNWS